MQYDWKYRVYQSKGKSSLNFDDLVNGSVRVFITRDMFYPHTGQRTPFARINLRPYQDSPELAQFLINYIPATGKDFHIWSELKKAITEAWMPGKIHLIGASSGYDSRILAKAIKELTIEKGTKWLGETYFVELSGEAEGFTKVMQAIGWTEKNYIIIEPNYNFEYFRDIHKRFNGLCAYPMNQWYDEYVKRWDENKIQYISGYGGNISDAMRRKGAFLKPVKNRLDLYDKLRLYFKWNYNYQLSAFRQPKYSFHPFWSWRYIKAIGGFDHNEAKTSIYLCKHFVPECNHIRRETILGDVTNKGYRAVTELTKMYEWFKSTRYGKTSNIKPRGKIEYNRWWLEYCIASYVEANNIDLR